MIQPPAVRYAGFLVAAEGLAGLIAAVVLVVRGIDGADQHVVSGYGTATWFLLVGGAVLAAGWALINGRRWGRGLAVFFNLLLLGVAWYIFGSHQVGYAIGVALVALVALGLLFSPSTVQWMSKRD
jgi:peptidoglycan/LPS O-acetylase OafA/YrhL